MKPLQASRRKTPAVGLLAPASLLYAGAFCVPVLLLLPASLQLYVPNQGIRPHAYSLENYYRLLSDAYYLEIFGRTLLLGLVVTAITILLAYPIALYLARTRARYRNWLVLLVIYPMMLNLVVRTFGFIALLANHGLVNDALIGIGIIDSPLKLMYNFRGLLIGLTQIYFPFAVLVLIPAIQSVPTEMEEASRTLGGGWFTTFCRVTLPLTANGIATAAALIFLLTESALVAPRLLGGPTYKVAATLIYDQFLVLLNWPLGSAATWILLFTALPIASFFGLAARQWSAR